METVTLGAADQQGTGTGILDDVIEKLDQWQDIHFSPQERPYGVTHR